MNLSDNPFLYIEPQERNENGHILHCTCVDCFGDFSHGDNEKELGDEY